jgi:hypothetical protein
MTLRAVGFNMRSRKGKVRMIVIEVRIAPSRRTMTNRAVLRKSLRDVTCRTFVAGPVTVVTADGRPRITAHMTLRAVGLNVHTSQWKCSQIMIQLRARPTVDRVADLAFMGIEIAVMRRIGCLVIIRLVTEETS